MTIRRRNISFDLTSVDMDNWHTQGCFVSRIFNAASLLFPDGERFFINAVRNYREGVADPELLAAINGFIGQEATHGREHELYNELLAKKGHPVSKILKRVKGSLEFAKRNFSHAEQLRITVALEHITAILARSIMEDRGKMSSSSQEMERMWFWHAMEESEHKAVAFDLYKKAVCHDNETSAMLLRRKFVMSRSTTFFIIMLALNFLALTSDKKELIQVKQWKALYKFIFGDTGIWTAIKPQYKLFSLPGFHPNILNEDSLLAKLKSDFFAKEDGYGIKLAA